MVFASLPKAPSLRLLSVALSKPSMRMAGMKFLMRIISWQGLSSASVPLANGGHVIQMRLRAGG